MAPIWFWRQTEQPYGIFSQWYPCTFTHEGREFSSAEQFMMWSKAMLFNDDSAAEKIMCTKDCRAQQGIGRVVQNYDDATWDSNKLNIVVAGNRLKFTQSVTAASHRKGAGVLLRDFLLTSGTRELVETSPHDRIWGIGLSEAHAPTSDRAHWGQNLLGRALMQVREELRAEDAQKNKMQTQT